MLSWVHTSLSPKCISIGSAVFAQLTTEGPLYFTMGRPFPHLKLTLRVGDLNPRLTHTSLTNPSQHLNGISIGSAVFAGLTITNIVNLSLTSGHFHPYAILKESVISPLVKKSTIDKPEKHVLDGASDPMRRGNFKAGRAI